MIRIDRGPPPVEFNQRAHLRRKEQIEAEFSQIDAKKRQSMPDFTPVDKLERVISGVAHRRFSFKCAFCESQIKKDDKNPIDRYRPKSGARGLDSSGGFTEEAPYHDYHYWWLSLDWDNILVVCAACRRFKGSWFPLENEEMRAALPGTTGPSIDEEKPLLLDPCFDDPFQHIEFETNGTVVSLTLRGQATIDILKLNRLDLVSSRRRALLEVFDLFLVAGDYSDKEALEYAEPIVREAQERPPKDKGSGIDKPWIEAPSFRTAIRELNEIYEPPSAGGRPYLGISRQYLKVWLTSFPDAEKRLRPHLNWVGTPQEKDLTDHVDRRVRRGELPAEGFDLGNIALERIELHNFRNIENLVLEVPPTSISGKTPWFMFLGENAVGKSTIMQAIALTLMGDENRREISDLKVDDVLRYYREGGEFKQSDEGWVKIWHSGSPEPLELRFNKGDPDFHTNVPTPRTYLIGYGPTRLFPEKGGEKYESKGKVRVKNLFRPSTPLADIDDWLYGLSENDPAHFDRMVRGLRAMLLMKEDESIERDKENNDKRRVLIEIKNEITTISNLSDGYRTILALVGDMMYTLSRSGTSMEEAEGIVIIDEIGTNLHPSWKKRVVSCFRRVFPRIQFIATTHEPLCLRGLDKGETILLRRDYRDKIIAITNLPNPNDLRVDELLSSEFFGLASTLESDLEEIYEEYYRLLTESNPNKKQRKRIDELKDQLRERQHLGDGLRDELMYEVIDKLLAAHMLSPRPKERPALKRETVEKVLEAWKKSGLYEDYLPKND